MYHGRHGSGPKLAGHEYAVHRARAHLDAAITTR
jgi:hypothetical protein